MQNQPRSFGATWSLRRTLLTILLMLTIAVWGCSAIFVYLEADQESQELFDQSLAETAHLLLTLANHEVEESMAIGPSTLAESNNHGHSQYLLFQIWDSKQHLLYKNAGAPDVPFGATASTGFGWVSLHGQRWRTYTSWSVDRRLQIQVGEPSSHRKEISGRFAWKLFWFGLLVLPLMATSIWWAVMRVFHALQKSADAVSQRTPNDLQKVSLEGTPSEVQPLLHAINLLFDRVRRTLEHEQRFTADAAHELRTPLAAIKTNLQVMQRARNDGERAEFITGLSISVDRATRLVEQLMTLARLDPQYEKQDALETLDLASLLAAQLPSLRLQADKLELDFAANLAPAPCRVHSDSLMILLRNLMDNAFRYTPQGGAVQLSCRILEQTVRLRVADSGSGIPFEMRERVFDRFFRLSDASKPGSGLGLSIVKRIVDIHGATISLSEGLNGYGLAVEVRFPFA